MNLFQKYLERVPKETQRYVELEGELRIILHNRIAEKEMRISTLSHLSGLSETKIRRLLKGESLFNIKDIACLEKALDFVMIYTTYKEEEDVNNGGRRVNYYAQY